jgi:hypothetical protein
MKNILKNIKKQEIILSNDIYKKTSSNLAVTTLIIALVDFILIIIRIVFY